MSTFCVVIVSSVISLDGEGKRYVCDPLPDYIAEVAMGVVVVGGGASVPLIMLVGLLICLRRY